MAKQQNNIDRQVAVSKIGMNKDNHPTSLDEKSYVHALNANYEGQDGDLINLQNEESNILCSKFNTGFKVIGFQKDITADRTYFFLTNPSTGQSEIGYISELENQQSFTDSLRKCGCSVEAVLADGLENIAQAASCQYFTLISDYNCSNGAAASNCLNFNINYPISSVLKDDKGNKILYFTDDLNPRRRLEIDFLDQYYVETEFCSDDPSSPDYDPNCDCGSVDRPVCINCDRLNVLPKHEPLCINVDGTVIGGNLRHGQYAFFVGYSDINGNMMTRYLSATNTVSINDPNRLVYEQPSLDALTNFSIKLNIENLNPDFEYYKVAVVETTSVDGTKSYYSVGVFPTSQSEVVYSGSVNRNEDRISSAEIVRAFPDYLKAKLVTATNNTLLFGDLEARPDPNLQPVVNFMGQFAKWRTVIANEDLYEKSFGSSNFRGYMRDEVVPFGIRFLTTNGYVTPVYPLISRIATDADNFFDSTHQAGYNPTDGTNSVIQQIKSSATYGDVTATGAWARDVYSVLRYGNENCADVERIFKWQYYNTAYQQGGIIDGCTDLEPIVIQRDVSKVCSNIEETKVDPAIPAITSLILTFQEGAELPSFGEGDDCVNGSQRYLNFEEYVQQNQDVFKDIVTDPTSTANQVNLAKRFIFDNYQGTGLFAGEYPCCDPGFPDDCGEASLTNTVIEAISANEDPCVNVKYYDCDYYDRVGMSDFCFPFTLDDGGDFKSINAKEEIEFTNSGGTVTDILDLYEFFVGKRGKKDRFDLVFERQTPISGGIEPLNATTLPVDFDEYDSAFSTYITPEFPDIVYDSDVNVIPMSDNDLYLDQAVQLLERNYLASSFPATPDQPGGRIKKLQCVKENDIDYKGIFINDTTVGFAPNPTYGTRGRVHTNAMWYKIDVTNKDKVYFSLSKASDADKQKSKRDCLWYTEKVRVSFFESLGSGSVPFTDLDHCGGEDDFNSALIQIDTSADGVVELDIKAARDRLSSPFNGNTIYIAVDSPLVRVKHDGNQKKSQFRNKGLGGNPHVNDGGQFKYIYASPTYCFNVKTQGQVIEEIEAFVANTSISFEKNCFFTSSCPLKTYENIQCDPFVRTEGAFSYWESTDQYPNNEYLYNSATKDDGTALLVDSNLIPASIQTEFRNTFTTGTYMSGTPYYNLSSNANFKCKPIRHFKFPDFAVSPTFGTDDGLFSQPVPFTETKIFPIGFHIDNEVVKAFLDVAVTNDLITQDFRNSITHYEIFRGDIKINKSIVAKGLMYDMYKAPERDDGKVINENTYFSNFPYNDLSDNKLIFEKENRKNFLKHPFTDKSNNRFTFHSPDTLYERVPAPFELYMEGDLVGNSRGAFAQVEDHPALTVLSPKAYRVARLLGGAQTTLEFLTNISSALIGVAQSMYAGVGSTNYGVPVAWTGFGLYAGTALLNLVPQGRDNVYRWISIFRGLGPDINYAYYYSSVGDYNGAYVPGGVAGEVPYSGDKLRGLKEKFYIDNGRYRVDEIYDDNPTIINNFNRESSIYLSTGTEKDGAGNVSYPFNIKKDAYIKNYDNSRFSDSQASCTKGVRSSEITANIATPYVSLKRFVPNQYKQINDIVWYSTAYCGNLTKTNSCDVVFGGDTFLSKFYQKRKFPFFTAPMIVGTQSLGNVPFAYSIVKNVGFPRYYLDYQFDQSDDVTLYGDTPILKSDFVFDCEFSRKLYMKLPSKFYLYYYGIPGFIVESRINNNFRYGQNESDKFFYPGTKDYIQWTQENFVSIRESEEFLYNETYSKENDLVTFSTLPATYDPEIWNVKYDHFDRVIFSLPDNNEQDLTDNFRVFLGNNYYDFGNKYGTLFDIKNIEQEKVLTRFDNGSVIFNAYNVISGDVEDVALAQESRSLFGNTRPSDFFKTDLGYGGTQNRAIVSCQFGHYWADAKRGRVYGVAPGGKNWDELSNQGMKNWFRENLPFRIKKQFPNMPDDMLDNAYDGIGITMTWDDRFLRLFLTKLDVKVKDEYLSGVTIEGLDFYYAPSRGAKKIKIHPTDTTYFEPCSWTISYSPSLKAWVSFHSFKPNYYVNHQNYFSSGLNYGSEGIWNHLLGSNQTFQVYYGTLYPFTIEVPLKYNLMTKMYEDMSYRLDVRRYTTQYDSHYYEDNFDTLVLYNDRESTGLLNLITQEQNSQRQLVELPRYNSNSIDIIATNENYTWSVNFFFDNVKEKHQQPIWKHACNNVDKDLNNDAFDYRPRFKNHIRGQYIIAQLSQKDESRLKFIFEHLIMDSHMYDAY